MEEQDFYPVDHSDPTDEIAKDFPLLLDLSRSEGRQLTSRRD
jgi:hypothetical protein